MSARNTALVWDALTQRPHMTDHAKIGLLALAEVAADQSTSSTITGDGLRRMQQLTGWTVDQVEDFYRQAVGTDEVIGLWSGVHFDMLDVCERVEGWRQQ